MTNNSFTLPTGQTFSIFVPNETIPSTEFKRGLSYEQVEKVVKDLYSSTSPQKIGQFLDVANRAKVVY